MYICLHIHACTHMFIWVPYGWCVFSSLSLPSIWDKSSPWAWRSLTLLGRLGSTPQGLSHFHSSYTRMGMQLLPSYLHCKYFVSWATTQCSKRVVLGCCVTLLVLKIAIQFENGPGMSENSWILSMLSASSCELMVLYWSYHAWMILMSLKNDSG